MSTNDDSLPGALSREIARVTAKKARWDAMFTGDPGLKRAGSLAYGVMADEILAAQRALASGDVAQMAGMLEDLRGYSDDD